MKGFRSTLVVITILVAVALAACGPAATEKPAAEEGKAKVAMLFPGQVFDKSWNEEGFKGLKQAEEQCGVTIAYTENVKQAEHLESFRNYAAQGYDIIIGHGGEFYDAAKTAASEYPNLHFVLIMGLDAADNLSGSVLSFADMGYLAGVLACNMTKTNKVANVVGGVFPIMEQGMKGFENGVKRCGKNTEVKTVDISSFDDVTKAYEAASVLIGEGVDVLWHIADNAGTGVLTAAQDKGVSAIGLYSDQSSVAPKAVIGSALGSPDAAVRLAACGQVEKGKVVYIGASTPGGPSIVMAETVPDEVKAAVNQALLELQEGKVSALGN
jgi:basic membrane protein A and related proteins